MSKPYLKNRYTENGSFLVITGIFSGLGTMKSMRFLSYLNLILSKQGVKEYSKRSIICSDGSIQSFMKIAFPFPASAIYFTRVYEQPLPIPIACTLVVFIDLFINEIISPGYHTSPSVNT